MEIIQLSGYTEEEKIQIARKYLLPRQLSEHGLPEHALEMAPGALSLIISEYTREAGVRNLERQLGTIARKVAARLVTLAPGDPVPRTIVDREHVAEYLGSPRFKKEVAFRTQRPGVATGVAWTETGGDVLFIEATLLPGGNQNIILTGQLGNVMQESARAALSHLRANAEELGLSPDFLAGHDLHVHVPAGAIPKDGPSAGVTIATAILSAARKQPVRQDLAMTGEITLSGLVLPVGGIREKALAARSLALRTFVIPALNAPDLADLPEEVRRDMHFVPVETLEQVLKEAMPDPVRAGADLPRGNVERPH
jgi:ATP-dependent Lon protease